MYDPNRMWNFLGEALRCMGVVDKGNEEQNCSPEVRDWITRKSFHVCENLSFSSPQYEHWEPILVNDVHYNGPRSRKVIKASTNVVRQICN